MFRAPVPTKVTVTPSSEDVEPLEHVVELHLDVVDERLVCTQLQVRGLDGRPHPVTAEVLRRIPVGRYVRDAASKALAVLEVDPADERRTRPFEWPPAGFAAAGPTDEVLREVARLYYWALATGDAPLGLLDRRYGIPRGRASRWIATARRRGYIKDSVDAG
jgi:hypothetical protein